ncbi:TonB-dependent receptor [Pedobacter sp. HDW13]|uniref:outer membrane beta-barrel protein n=1 Tax=unclassified Pedobacter TaxID=2628915 RepID=UPI000F5B0594|nr:MULTISPECIES: outer membrane beta-barrel protein [unclassified Pedobacter]QIL39338.1 TonB-dependent receptor [Pedobacter sp. HDW13]RQO65573.1 TonB-dependent receptor [Pedobacter sp. KBW01]
MKNLYKISFILSFFFTTTQLFAQTTAKPNISGVILDENNKPADYVTVVLFKAADSSIVKTAFTDPNGTFGFIVPGKGSYFYKASNMGYKTFKSKTVTVAEDNQKIDFGTAQLVATAQNLKEVNVAVTKPLIERKMDKIVMNVSNSSIMTGSSALEVLQKAPGVTVDQNDKISMMGKQGVLIQLDGKQTYMSSADVANLLRNMQSSDIESIELITNPSSKYDASGNSGIINIKTKKNKNGGTNGSVNGSLGYGKNLRANAGLNLNHRTQKLNLFGNYNYGKFERDNLIAIDRISNGTPDTYFMQVGESNRKQYNNNFKAGLDYFIDKKNTIGLLVNGYFNHGTEAAGNNTLIGPSFQKIDSTLISNSLQTNKYNNVSYNLNYKSVLDTAGSEISADVDYSKYNGNDGSDYANDYLFANGNRIRPISYIRNNTPSIIDIKAFKVDYNVSLSKTVKLEAGVKSSWVKTDNDLQAEEFVNNVWQNDVRRSNQFIYDENVNAAYTNLNKQFKNTSVQIGLRMEQTNSKGNLVTTNTVVKRNYWDFFPTLFVQQNLSKNNQLGFSYSRRIDRPSYDALNPFIYYLDQYTYSKGNPFLNPQYTHNFELSYTLLQKYILSIGYSRVNDVIAEVILPDAVNKALYQTNANIATNISYNANLNVPVQITKWWQTNNNLNVFYLSFEAPDLAGSALKTGKTSFQFKSQQTFTIVNGFTAELNGNYESPLDYGTLSLKARYSIDAGLSKTLFNKKASLKLALSDIFNMSENNLSSAYPGLTYTVHQKNETRVGRISFTYRFGKNEIKPARRRTTGTEAEQGRMKN